MASDIDMAITSVLSSVTNCNMNLGMTVKAAMADQNQCVKDKMESAHFMKAAIIDGSNGSWYNFFMDLSKFFGGVAASETNCAVGFSAVDRGDTSGTSGGSGSSSSNTTISNASLTANTQTLETPSFIKKLLFWEEKVEFY